MQEKIKYIVKRDGKTEIFSDDKIYQALYSAFKEVGITEGVCLETLVEKVEKRLGEVTSVEEVQNACVSVLMNSKYKAVAESFIKYRTERDQVREGKSPILTDITSFLEGTDDTHQTENSNKSNSNHQDL